MSKEIKGFEKFIMNNHPEPDTLVHDLEVFNQMVKLGEEYAKSQIEAKMPNEIYRAYLDGRLDELDKTKGNMDVALFFEEKSRDYSDKWLENQILKP